MNQTILGNGPCIFTWDPQSQYLAVSGSTLTVYILDRRKYIYEQLVPTAPNICAQLEWDGTGSHLAILQTGTHHDVFMWEKSSRGVKDVKIPAKDTSFLSFSKGGTNVALCTAHGDVLIYDMRKNTYIYSDCSQKKKILIGDWNRRNLFAFASDERQISIVDLSGAIVGKVKVKAKPTAIIFGGTTKDRENTISVCMDQKTIFLYDLDDPDNAIELAFQERYGTIVSYKWFKDGHIMIGFSNGFLVVISTELAEIGREQFCGRLYEDCLRGMAYNEAKNMVATRNDTCIKVYDMSNWKECLVEQVPESMQPLDRMEWTNDGTILTVSTKNGYVLAYGMATGLIKSAAEIDESIIRTCLERPFDELSLLLAILHVILFASFVFSQCFSYPFISVFSALWHAPVI